MNVDIDGWRQSTGDSQRQQLAVNKKPESKQEAAPVNKASPSDCNSNLFQRGTEEVPVSQM